MTDKDLFTTFVTATPEQLVRVVEKLLVLPWNTGADAAAEHTIEGISVTSSEDADVHELEFIRSTDFAGDAGERFTAVVNRAAPVVTAIVDATTTAWGKPGVFREAEDPTACTLFEVIMDILGVDEVLAWQRDGRYILFSEGVQQDSDDYAAAFWVVSRSVVEDVAYSIAPAPQDEKVQWAPSALEQRLTERLGPETTLPVPLCRAWSFMESQGWGGTDVHGDPILTPYPGDEQLGPVFSSSLSTRGWLEPDAPGAERLVPIAETDGSGGFAAIWFDEAGAPRFFWFSSESGQAQGLADDPVDFLRLIAMGYSEFADWVWGASPDSFADTQLEETEGGEELLVSDPVLAHGEFRTWVEETFDVAVPKIWTVSDDPEFNTWLTAMVGAHGIGAHQAQRSDELVAATPPAADNSEVQIEGDLFRFVVLLGEEDDWEAAETASSLLDITTGDTLRSSAEALTEVGVEVDSTSARVETIWLSMRDYPRPEQLVHGLAEGPTRDDVLSFLGEPQAAGEHWLRYVSNGRYVHFEFDDRLTRITLMVDAP